MRHFCPFFSKHAKAGVALFFLALLLVGLFTVGDYGSAWDDWSEMRILRMALREYDALLPWDTSLGQTLSEMGIERLSESAERDHGICLYYPLFWAVGNASLSLQSLTFIWRCYTWILFTLGLAALYAVARRMGLSRGFACLGALIVFLSPRFFAEGHYNNKDIPLMAMTLVLLWQSARLMEKPTYARGLCFALAAGLCTGTRIIGGAYCLLFGGMIVCYLCATHRMNRRTIGVAVCTAGLSLAFYILLTPCLLADPPGFIAYLLKNAVGFSRWHGNVLWFGQIIPCSQTKPPRLYLPVMILLSTPLWALALLAASVPLAFRRLRRAGRGLLCDSQRLLRLTAQLAWIAPLIALVALRALVYNGWRHVYFLYGPMALCMASALQALWRLAQKKGQKALLALCIALCLLSSAVGIAANHPHQYAYWNALVPTQNRAERFELDWWNLSGVDALKALLAQTEGPVVVMASDSYSRSGLIMSGTLLNSDRVIVADTLEDRPGYLFSNLSYAAMAGFEPEANMNPVVTISSYGAPVAVIYSLEGGDSL